MGRQIKLTRGYIAIVDEWNYDWLYQYTWCYSGGYKYPGYAATTINGKLVYMHHLIKGKPETGKHVDHINKNTLDNQEDNLVIKSHGANLRNNNKRCIYKVGNRFVVKVKLNRISHNKAFYTLQEAEAWRDNFKKQHDR